MSAENSSAARSTTPNQPERVQECPGAPERKRPMVDTSAPAGHEQVIRELFAESPRARPSTPKKLRRPSKSRVEDILPTKLSFE
jgi:hypothetical protein